MIFFTLGTTIPFKRLVIAMDDIAMRLKEVEIIAQISDNKEALHNLQPIGFVSPIEYYKLFCAAKLIVSHAGMGTIISALQYGKKIIVMPRKASLGESNSDHQIYTASRLQQLGLIKVANDQQQLMKHICESLKEPAGVPIIGPYASVELLMELKNEIGTH